MSDMESKMRKKLVGTRSFLLEMKTETLKIFPTSPTMDMASCAYLAPSTVASILAFWVVTGYKQECSSLQNGNPSGRLECSLACEDGWLVVVPRSFWLIPSTDTELQEPPE